MVEAAGQEGIVLKIFKKLRGVWLALDLVTLEGGECRALQLLLYTCTLGWYFEVWQFDLMSLWWEVKCTRVMRSGSPLFINHPGRQNLPSFKDHPEG